MPTFTAVTRFRHPFPALQSIIVLLLAVMALQALPPKPLLLQVDNGPAFSASSVEVALPARRLVGVEHKVAPIIPPLTDWPEESFVRPLAANDTDGLWLAPVRLPPPPIDVLEPAAPPRAPPAS